jgi:hypothetical protein
MDMGRTPSIQASQVAAAALLAQVFALYLLLLRAVVSVSEAQWAASDPILRIAPRQLTLWSVPLVSIAAALWWLGRARPSSEELRRAALRATLGVFVALAAVLLLRAMVGPRLPSFIPSEESARPGFFLSMSAGYFEEVVVRMLLLPIVYFALRERMPRGALLASIVLSSLFFAFWHQLGPEHGSLRFFMTRALVPGVAMSVAFFIVGPAFVIFAHGAAHLLIPALFQ